VTGLAALGEHPAEPLAEPPDGQGEAIEAARATRTVGRQAIPSASSSCREPNAAAAAPGVRSDQVRAPGDRAGHGTRVPCRGCREHPGETLTKHEGLVLPHRAEQPQGGQRPGNA
jgi:hypothetical protein